MSGQTSKMVAHDKAEPSRLKQELKRSKRSKNELVKNLQLEESRTSTKNKDTIHNKEPDTESSDPESEWEVFYMSKYKEYMDDEDGGEYCGTLYTECALCSTPIIQYDEMYCNEGCPKEALDKLDENIQLVIIRDSDEPDYKNSNKETSTQPIASETAVKTKNIATDISKTSCNKKTSNITKITKNTGDTARSNSKVTAETKLNHAGRVR